MRTAARTIASVVVSLLGGGVVVALGQDTPAPVIEPGQPCPAVVRVSWDVSSIEDATRVRWQVRADAEGGAPLDAGAWEGTAGTAEIDLRPFAPVLNGRPFYVRVRPRAPGMGNVGPWSPAAVFDASHPAPSVTASRSPDDGFTVDLTWQPAPAIEACASGAAYEVTGPNQYFSVLDGPQPEALATGVLPASSGSTSIDVSGPSGVYRIRAVALGGSDPAGDIGLRGYGAPVPLGGGRLTVTAHDATGTACGGQGVYATGAVVTVSGESHYDGPIQATATLGDVAAHTFDLPPGEYTVTGTRGRCAALQPVTVSLSLGENKSASLFFDCPAPEVDLAVAIEAPASAPVSGQPFDLAVTVIHDHSGGSSAEREVEVVREAPPMPVTARGARRGRATVERVVGRATVEPLCPGEMRVVSITEEGAESGDWVYRARLSGRDSDPGNDSATAPVTVEEAPVPLPDLALAVVQSHETLPPGETITYTVSLGNQGEADASGVLVRNIVSRFLDFVSASGSHGFDCVEGNTVSMGLYVLCTGDLPVGVTATIEITASLVATAGAGNILSFIAWADPEDEVEESDEDNNHWIFSATTGASIELVTHEVPNPLLVSMLYIEEQGFGKSVAKLSKGGECSFGTVGGGLTPESTMTFRADGGGPVNSLTLCEFRLLRNRPLNEPWTVESVSLDPATGSDFAWQSGSVCTVVSTAPEILIRLEHPASQTLTPGGLSPGRYTGCHLAGLELEGPAGADWQDAFE